MKKKLAIFAAVFLGGCSLATPDKKNCDACLDAGTDIDPPAVKPDTKADAKPAVKPDIQADAKKPDPVYVDNDKDGYYSDVDCDDNNPNIHPNAPEICNGKDDNCDGQIDNDLTDTGASCGSAVGECKPGKLACVNGKLECTGFVGPKNEICDGKDNNCDGQIDENFIDLGKVCEVGVGECKRTGYYVCNGSATKLKCSVEPAAPQMEGPPGSSSCSDGIDNDCDGLIDLNDPDCKQCVADADCNENNPCVFSKCLAGSCQKTLYANGTNCSDGIYCNGLETCQNGKCTPGPKVLCDDGNQCTTDTCDEAQKKCVFIAVPVKGKEGLPGSAECLDGQDNDCDGLTDLQDPDCQGCKNDLECAGANPDPCINYICTAQMVCKNSPKSEGASCDIGQASFCNGEKTCKSGACVQGTPRNCDDGNICTIDSCNEILRQCVHTLQMGCGCTSAADCDDKNSCTADSCENGYCKNISLAVGSSCDDKQFCTVNDKCALVGTVLSCLGTLRDCSPYADACNASICDESLDICKKIPKADGTSCDDGQWCTIGDYCVNGYCQGGGQRNCYPGTCNESTDTCDNINSGPGCADGTREGFLDGTTFPNIAGCSGTWSTPGLTNANYLCAFGWHICNGASDVSSRLPFGKTCADAWSGSEKRFFATFQSSGGFGYCNTPGTNDIFGCGNYGDPPAPGGSCNPLNVFSSEDCGAIKYPYLGAPETWRCGNTSVDSSDELVTVVKLQFIGGGVLCCRN